MKLKPLIFDEVMKEDKRLKITIYGPEAGIKVFTKVIAQAKEYHLTKPFNNN